MRLVTGYENTNTVDVYQNGMSVYIQEKMYIKPDISANVEKLPGLKSVSVRDWKTDNLVDAHWVEVPNINANVYAVVFMLNGIIMDMPV